MNVSLPSVPNQMSGCGVTVFTYIVIHRFALPPSLSSPLFLCFLHFYLLFSSSCSFFLLNYVKEKPNCVANVLLGN